MLACQIGLRIALASGVCGAGGDNAAVDFEGVPVGTVYGSTAVPAHNPGDPVLEESGVVMSVETFFLSQVLTDFFSAEVVTRDLGSGPSNALAMNSIGVLFDFAGVGFPVGQVTLSFLDEGGTTNFAVNGGDLYILEFLDQVPSDVAPGVLAEFSGNTLTVTGVSMDITDLRIGGQELVIDHVVAVPEPATGLLLVAGMLAFTRRRTRVRGTGP